MSRKKREQQYAGKQSRVVVFVLTSLCWLFCLVYVVYVVLVKLERNTEPNESRALKSTDVSRVKISYKKKKKR